MNRPINLLLTLLLSIMGPVVLAQNEVPMADGMRSEGKIYVVVGILLIILTGLLLYVFLLDRKISRLEKKIDKKP